MNRRQQIALTPEEQRDYLAQSHTIILVSNDRHGYPHPVAMWYLAEPDGSVVMTTFRKSQKALSTDLIMHRIAALLDERHRGPYAEAAD